VVRKRIQKKEKEKEKREEKIVATKKLGAAFGRNQNNWLSSNKVV